MFHILRSSVLCMLAMATTMYASDEGHAHVRESERPSEADEVSSTRRRNRYKDRKVYAELEQYFFDTVNQYCKEHGAEHKNNEL